MDFISLRRKGNILVQYDVVRSYRVYIGSQWVFTWYYHKESIGIINRLLFGFFTISQSDAFLSDYLTDLKLHRTKSISSKIAPSGRSVKWAFFCFMHHFTCWTLFISGINRAWLYKGLSDSQRQPNSDLAQWQSMGLMIWRLWVQTPLGAFFDEIYFVLCNFRSVR